MDSLNCRRSKTLNSCLHIGLNYRCNITAVDPGQPHIYGISGCSKPIDRKSPSKIWRSVFADPQVCCARAASTAHQSVSRSKQTSRSGRRFKRLLLSTGTYQKHPSPVGGRCRGRARPAARGWGRSSGAIRSLSSTRRRRALRDRRPSRVGPPWTWWSFLLNYQRPIIS